MTTRTLATAAVTLAAVPVCLGALLLRGRYVLDRQYVEINPYELDLQLRERNDEE